MTKKVKARKHDLVCEDPHLTKQDHGGTADINYIAQQYAHGRLPYPENPPAFYGDISAIDVQKSRNTIAQVESAFASLPSDVRHHFGHDAKAYVAFLEENASEIVSGGLRNVLWNEVNEEEVVSGETNSAQKAPENPVATEDEPATE